MGLEVRKCPRKEDENKKGEKIEVVFKENDYIQSVMIKYFVFLDFFLKKMPFILPAKLFKLQTSNLNSKLPDSYLIPKEQSAQREERKEVERISRGFGGGRGKTRWRSGEGGKEQSRQSTSPASPALLLTA